MNEKGMILKGENMKTKYSTVVIDIICIILCISCMSLTAIFGHKNKQLIIQNEELTTTNSQLQDEIDILSGKVKVHNCPLCDSEVEVEHDYEWGYRVNCHNCFLSIWYYDTANEAISAWNSLTKEESIPPTMMAQGD